MKSYCRLFIKVIGLTFLGLLVAHPFLGLAQTSAPPKARPALYEFGAGYCFSCKEMEKIMGELQATWRPGGSPDGLRR